MAARKTATKAPAAKEPAPKKAPAAKKAAQKKATAGAPRGAALVEQIAAALRGPRSPIGEPRPLDEAEILAAERAAGVALSPSMHALLSFDAGWIGREYGWFDGKKLLARPAIEVIAEHAGVFAECY